jgi:hypothetical protein
MVKDSKRFADNGGEGLRLHGLPEAMKARTVAARISSCTQWKPVGLQKSPWPVFIDGRATRVSVSIGEQ